jgi:mxaA protein
MGGKALTALFLVCLSGEPLAALRSVEVDTPRAFGYTIGDVFDHGVSITVDDPWRLDRGSLPGNERIGLWFERQLLRFDELRVTKGVRYRLKIRYQIFNAPPDPLEVFTPALELRIVNGGKQMPVFVRAWGATIVPLTRNGTLQPVDYLNLQPPDRPPPRNSRTPALMLAAGGAGLLFSLMVTAYMFGSLPGVRRTRGPFARTLKRIKALPGAGTEADAYRQALRYLHQAFNETAGRVVTGDELDRFFAEQPRHARLREPIEHLFSRTSLEFFEPGRLPGDRDIGELLKLCRHCRDVERGLL